MFLRYEKIPRLSPKDEYKYRIRDSRFSTEVYLGKYPPFSLDLIIGFLAIYIDKDDNVAKNLLRIKSYCNFGIANPKILLPTNKRRLFRDIKEDCGAHYFIDADIHAKYKCRILREVNSLYKI